MLVDGPDTYARMLEVIAGAERWVHFENYIIRSDAAGWRFAELLAARARAGVRVRVLYDWLGSAGTARRYWRFLRAAGVEVRAFNPPRPLDLVGNLSRNHRKLVVADGARAVMGGLCIGCEWTGEVAPDGRPWRDTAVEIRGPAAAALDQAFAVTWQVAGGAFAAGEEIGEVPAMGRAAVRVIAGEPGRERAFRVIELLAAGAVERLWITDAYLVAPGRLLQALRDAARDGVDVRLLVPSSSDVPFVRNLTRIGYRELLGAGVRIFEWDGPMLHAKTIVVDGRWVRIGSSNLNPSSLLGNYELDVLVEDPALAAALEGQFRRDIAQSREVSRRRVRGPGRISQRLPTALTHLEAETPAPARYRESRREARARAVVQLRTLASNARRSVFGPLTIGLVALSFLFLVLPRPTAYVFGALCVWLALGAGREAFRRRADR
ncbi:MAG TPA: phospholipase D-like domain-containing protein [Gemmatimonadales bacterium]|nr:phospholipase D-like domain-containing protein [Gemmatimonadales bacterium]